MKAELEHLESFRPSRYKEKNWKRIRQLERLIAAGSKRSRTASAREPARKKPRVVTPIPGGRISAPSLPMTRAEMEASARGASSNRAMADVVSVAVVQPSADPGAVTSMSLGGKRSAELVSAPFTRPRKRPKPAVIPPSVAEIRTAVADSGGPGGASLDVLTDSLRDMTATTQPLEIPSSRPPRPPRVMSALLENPPASHIHGPAVHTHASVIESRRESMPTAASVVGSSTGPHEQMPGRDAIPRWSRPGPSGALPPLEPGSPVIRPFRTDGGISASEGSPSDPDSPVLGPSDIRSRSRSRRDVPPRQRTRTEPYVSADVKSEVQAADVEEARGVLADMHRARTIITDHMDWGQARGEQIHGVGSHARAMALIHPRPQDHSGAHNQNWARGVISAHNRGQSMPQAVVNEAHGIPAGPQRYTPRVVGAPARGRGARGYGPARAVRGRGRPAAPAVPAAVPAAPVAPGHHAMPLVPVGGVYNPFAQLLQNVQNIWGAPPGGGGGAQVAQAQFALQTESTPTINVSPQQEFNTGNMIGITHARRLKLISGWIYIDGRTAQIICNYLGKSNASDIDQINAFLQTYFPMGATIDGQQFNSTSILTAVRTRLPGTVTVNA